MREWMHAMQVKELSIKCDKHSSCFNSFILWSKSRVKCLCYTFGSPATIWLSMPHSFTPRSILKKPVALKDCFTSRDISVIIIGTISLLLEIFIPVGLFFQL